MHQHHHEDQPAAPSTERVAMGRITVNGVAIPRKAIAAEVQNFPNGSASTGWAAATRALVVRELLLQEATRLGIAAEPTADADGRVETAEDAQIRALVDAQVRTPQTDADSLRRYYESNRRRFVTPALYEADHILVAAARADQDAYAAARQKAAALATTLAAEPARFAGFARDCSDCPSRSVGGSLGQIGPGQTTPEFEAALVALEPGQISGPVDTPYGVHVIRLVHRVDGRQLPFEAVQERIATYLREQVQRHALAQYVSLLVGQADIRGIDMAGASSPLVQ
jgi:peptidyl-prolyl cis-trans isomerase C